MVFDLVFQEKFPTVELSLIFFKIFLLHFFKFLIYIVLMVCGFCASHCSDFYSEVLTYRYSRLCVVSHPLAFTAVNFSPIYEMRQIQQKAIGKKKLSIEFFSLYLYFKFCTLYGAQKKRSTLFLVYNMRFHSMQKVLNCLIFHFKVENFKFFNDLENLLWCTSLQYSKKKHNKLYVNGSFLYDI